MFVIFIALFRRERLIEKESFRLITGISAVLFIVGLVFHSTDGWGYSMSGALLNPLVSLGLYRVCRKVFISRFNREPKDTFLDWQPELGKDRVFNIVYFVSAIWLAMLITIGMEELAKAGW